MMPDSQAHRISAQQRAIVLAIAFLAFVVRIAYVASVGPDRLPAYDEMTYDTLAQNIIGGRGYVLGQPTAFRPPGFPLLLAAFYTFVGPHFAAAQLAQAMLGAVTVALTYATAMAAYGAWRLALVASVGVALHPVLITLSGSILTETVFVCLIMAILWLMLISRTGLTTARTLALAVLLGVSVLTRPSVLIFAGLVALWCVFVSGLCRGVLYAAVVLAGIVILILPWTIRNYVQFGELIPFATEGGVTFWGGNNALATGGVVEPSPTTWPGSDPPAGLQGWTGLTEKESEDRFYASAFAWIKSHPQDFFALLPRKLVRAWSLAFGNEARENLLPGWITTAYLLFPLAAMLGLILSLPLWRHLVPIYLLLGSFALTTTAFYGSTRQSAVLFPTAIILAAYAVVSGYDHVRHRLEAGRRSTPVRQ